MTTQAATMKYAVTADTKALLEAVPPGGKS
jgi:hypothetical protein